MLMRRQVSAQRRHISAQACIWASSPMLAQSSAQRSHTFAQAPALLGLTAAVGLPACANSRDAVVEPSTETAQMDHGSMDLGPADESFDLRFIDAMIMHHQGAVVMAEDAQQNSLRPEIQTLASEIIAAQQTEIAEM